MLRAVLTERKTLAFQGLGKMYMEEIFTAKMDLVIWSGLGCICTTQHVTVLWRAVARVYENMEWKQRGRINLCFHNAGTVRKYILNKN